VRYPQRGPAADPESVVKQKRLCYVEPIGGAFSPMHIAASGSESIGRLNLRVRQRIDLRIGRHKADSTCPQDICWLF
jgi:hypothetical protein